MIRQQNRTIAVVLALLLVVAQIIPVQAQSDTVAPAANTPIRVGSKEFNEQLLLGKMFVLVLEEAGYIVDDQTGLGGSSVVRAALENNEIDLYPEYTGTALTLYHGLPTEALPNLAERAYELAKTLDEPKGLTWLDAAPMNNTFALIGRTELADEGIDTIEALADALNRSGNDLSICLESEFYGRADGLAGLEQLYGFSLPEENILVMESDETYANLRDGSCDVAQGVATDGRIAAWGFQALDDNLAFFPFYQPAPVVRTEILETYPELADLLGSLMALLDTATMTTLNARVDLGADGIADSGDEEAIEDVAVSFLTDHRLVKPAPIRVGSKEYTEQLVLGELMVLLLRDAGFEVEDLTGFGGTSAIRQAVEAGDIDIYPEYSGTATSVHHNIPVTALPTTAERAYVLAKSLDAPQGLIWLDRMDFNNTYTLMVRQELIDEGIRSIDDLAVFMNANESPLTLCVEGEFYARPDGLDGLQALYGFAFQEENVLVVETSDTYEKLRDGECDVAEGFATDGRINAWNFTNLEDTLAFFPFYNPTPVIRKEVLDLHPDLVGLLNKLSALLDEATMSALNARVDIGPDGQLASGDEESVEDVAYSFLRANRLVALPEIVVSATDTDGFQSVLSNMFMLILDDAGYQPVDRTDLGGSVLVRQAMLKGDVDIYIEAIITALTVYHELPVAALPTTRERAYVLARTLDKASDIIWLDMTPYAETTAIVTANALSDVGIESLDDFALYMNANEAPLTICMDNEFYGSEFNGLTALEELYGFSFQPENILLMDIDDILGALEGEQCDVAAASSLDALARGYSVLSDPLGFFLGFGNAPVVRKEILDQNPELTEVINRLIARLDAETVGGLDRLIELGADGKIDSGDEVSAYQAALDFLVNADLIAPPTEEPTPAEDSAAPDASSSIQEDATNETTGDGATDQSSEEGTPPANGEQPADGGTEGGAGGNPVPPEAPVLTQTNPQERRVDTSFDGATRSVADGAQAPSAAEPNPAIVVGSMGDTEQRLMGSMLLTMLRAGGYPVIDRTATGTSPDLRAMLERGEIDIYPEFTGVALSLYHNIPPSALPTTADGAFSLVKSLDESLGIVWIRKASFDSAYGLAISDNLAAQGVHTLFDLADILRTNRDALTFCVEDGFLVDTELGLPSVAGLYDFALSPDIIITLTSDDIYRSLRDGSCDVGNILRTDGRIGAWNLFVLEDTLGAFPNYSPAPVLRRDLLVRYPELEEYLGQLGPLLNSATITALNAQVDLGTDGEPVTGDEAAVDTVALAFLCDNQLIGSCSNPIVDASPATTTISESVAMTPVLTMIPITTPRGDSTPIVTVNAGVTGLGETTELTVSVIEPTVAEALDAASTEASIPVDSAQTRGAITVTTPATFGVNGRASADAAAEVVVVLPRNAIAQATGRTADSSWLQIITLDGQVAWVFTAAIISRPENIEQLPVVVPPTLSTTP